MPVTPQDLQKQIEERNKGAVQTAIKALEEALIKSAQFHGDVTKAYATHYIGGNLTPNAAETVCSSFRLNGWQAEIVGDMRDGDYIKISYKKPTIRPSTFYDR